MSSRATSLAGPRDAIVLPSFLASTTSASVSILTTGLLASTALDLPSTCMRIWETSEMSAVWHQVPPEADASV
jgi:hypothetical protein